MKKMEVVVKNIGNAFSVAVIPVLKDNYTYIIHDKATNTLAAVDVSNDTAPVIDYIKKFNNNNFTFRTILSTHKHWDHSGGNKILPKQLQINENFNIIGGVNDNIPGVTQKVREGDIFSLGELKVKVLDAPCHTSGHVLYKIFHPNYENDGAALFTGDTMFIGGIGAFFEGNAKDMCAALRKVYNINNNNNNLDSKTYVFPGHEYTVNFLRFSREIIPTTHPDASFITNQLEKYINSVAKGTPTIPSTLAEEKKQNLFLRTCEEAFVQSMKNHGSNAEEIMQYLYDACP